MISDVFYNGIIGLEYVMSLVEDKYTNWKVIQRISNVSKEV